MIFITLSYIVTTHDPHVYDPHEKEISHSVLKYWPMPVSIVGYWASIIKLQFALHTLFMRSQPKVCRIQ